MGIQKYYAQETPKESALAAVVTGRHGTGKTIWAITDAPDPLILDLENGSRRYMAINPKLKRIDAQKLTWPLFIALLDEIGDEHKTIIIDSADHAAQMLYEHLLQMFSVKLEKDSLVQAGNGFGHFYNVQDKYWRDFIKKLSGFISNGIHVICICHVDEVKKQKPNRSSFDSEKLRLPPRLAPQLCEWAELIGHIEIEDVEGTDGIESTRERVLHVEPDTHIFAKNRFNLEPSYINSCFGALLAEINGDNNIKRVSK